MQKLYQCKSNLPRLANRLAKRAKSPSLPGTWLFQRLNGLCQAIRASLDQIPVVTLGTRPIKPIYYPIKPTIPQLSLPEPQLSLPDPNNGGCTPF